MVKRKARDSEAALEPRRSTRQRSTAKNDVAANVDRSTSSSPETKSKAAKRSKKVIRPATKDVNGDKMTPKHVATKPEAEAKPAEAKAPCPGPLGRQFWLMKAEPESRMEKGHDIKFSIDDLASKTEPEPWDGIRNYAARNNLRAMKKGDLAFFYHSSCKIPAIVGTMEIVEEHTPDLSAHDASAPYYDPNSKPSNPKWSVVHVTFKQKFQSPITLKELKAWGDEKGNALANMQMLRLARMSVSKVSAEEWEFLAGEFEKRGDVVEP